MTNKFLSLIISCFQAFRPTYSTGYLASPIGSPVYTSNKAWLNHDLLTFTPKPPLLFIPVSSITIYSLSHDLLENQPYFCISTSSKCYHWPSLVNSTSLTYPVCISSLHPNELWPYFMSQYDLKETFKFFYLLLLFPLCIDSKGLFWNCIVQFLSGWKPFTRPLPPKGKTYGL